MIWILILSGGMIVTGLTMMFASNKEVDEEMLNEIKAAKQQPSFAERMQMWKYANEVISKCFSAEEAE